MPDNRPSLAGVDSKISRANEHLEELERAIHPLVQPETYCVAYKYESESGEHQWTLDSDPPLIPERIGPVLGEVLYGLRSALDHLIWQLVLANKKTPTQVNAFPIMAEDNSKSRKRIKDRIDGVCEDAKALIVAMQTCNGGDIHLGILEKLSNIDKHRHLLLTFAAVSSGSLSGPGLGALEFPFHPHVGPVSKDTVLMRVRGPSEIQINFTPAFSVDLNFEGIVDLDLLDTLRALVIATHQARSKFTHFFFD